VIADPFTVLAEEFIGKIRHVAASKIGGLCPVMPAVGVGGLGGG